MKIQLVVLREVANG